MTIDEEIKSSFTNEYHRAIVNLLYTNNYIEGKLSQTLRDFDITRQQYNVLRILRGQLPQPSSVLLIKSRMLDKMSDASRIVDRLKKKDLVAKSVCEQDRRSTDIVITDKGLALLEELDPIMSDYNSLIENLSEEEARELNQLLDKLRNRR